MHGAPYTSSRHDQFSEVELVQEGMPPMVDECQQWSPTYVQNTSSHHQLAEVDAVQEGTFHRFDGCQGWSMTYM